MRVDLLRTLDRVSTDDVLARVVRATLDGIEVPVIALDDLRRNLRNKRAAGRARDLEDVDFLERLRRRVPRSES